MALLGRRLRDMPPTDEDAVPLLNEAWQVCCACRVWEGGGEGEGEAKNDVFRKCA